MDEKNINTTYLDKWIKVQAYKHDGSLHREWSPAFLTYENEDYWALASRASLVTEHDGRRWMTKEHAVFFLFKKEWFNVISMLKSDGGVCYYANIASPAILDNGYLRYIDYDLDLKLFPNETIKELDQHEFEKHAQYYGYSPELKEIISKKFLALEKAMEIGSFPFIDSEVYQIYDRFLTLNRPFNPRIKK